MRSHGGGVTPGAQQGPAQGTQNAPTPATVPLPSQVHSLHELAAADPSLNATAIGKNTHLRLETGRAGDLTMHLRINDGVADIEVGGAAAEKLGMRSNELRRALAGEGLTLGQFLTRPTDAPAANGDDRGSVAMASASTTTAAPSPGAPSPSATPSLSSSSSSSSSSSNQDHRQNQGWHGAETSESPGAASAASAANGARARSAASSSATEGSGVPRRGLHVTA